MSKQLCRFEYVERDHVRTAVLLPGWAADHRIFNGVDLAYNYILPTRYEPDTVLSDLAQYLRQSGTGPVSLFGLSLGGFLSQEFAVMYPELVDELILVGIRKHYPVLELRAVELLVRQSKEQFLRQFFRQCVCAQTVARNGFLTTLAAEYAREATVADLLSGLQLLRRLRIDPEKLRQFARVTFVHGAKDRIAPLSEVRELVAELPQSRIVCFEQEGHIPFFATDFARRFHDQ